MLLTGDPIAAEEPYRLGMVNEIHPQAELLDAAHRIAAVASTGTTPRLTPHGRCSPLAVLRGGERGMAPNR